MNYLVRMAEMILRLSRLYYAMLDHSENWQRNKWWLFDRVVESPHRTSFFVRRSTANEKDAQEVAQFWSV